jgi:hypothetical protein
LHPHCGGWTEILQLFQDLYKEGCGYFSDQAFGWQADFNVGANIMFQSSTAGYTFIIDGFKDYKANEIPKGVYTVRFVMQPQDGDHLGTAEYPYFAVLIPAKSDPAVNGITTYKAMVKASGKDTSTGHPIVLSLRPVSSGDAESPKLTEPAPDQKCVQIKIPAKAPDADQPTTVVFELVYKGKGKI